MSSVIELNGSDENAFMIKIHDISSVDRSQQSSVLLRTPILARFNSMVPHMWLPLQVCQQFQEAFGLNWDSVSELYIVNDTIHDSLLARNITVKITLGSTKTPGERVTIDFPYSMFDLRVTYPIYNGVINYFPLRRAVNESQYTLGRAFLQGIYITADYDRGTFNVSRAVYDNNTERRVFAIAPPTSSDKPQDTSRKAALSGGAIAGITISVSTLILTIAGLLFAWRTNRPPFTRKQKQENTDVSILKPELDGKGKPYYELNAQDSEKVELEAIPGGELEGSPVPPTELPGIIPLYELRTENR
jgi:hypothetical protein